MEAGYITRRAPVVGVSGNGRVSTLSQSRTDPNPACFWPKSDAVRITAVLTAVERPRRSFMDEREEIQLDIEELEERIAPSQPPGLLGYEGHPGNQGGPQHHP